MNTTRFASASLCTVFALFAWGCGSSKAEPSVKAHGRASTESDGGATEKWQTLLSGDWAVPAGDEIYVCVRKTITEDMYVSGLQAINPPGTHHTFLAMGPPSGPDGVTRCSVAEVHAQAIFGSGVGTNPIKFPEGVGMKLTAGLQLLLNLHLFNTGTEELTGTSGTKVLPIEEGDVEYVGESKPVLNVDFSIPAHQVYSKVASTTLQADTTLFAVLPHMHQLGIHSKVTAGSSLEGEHVVHDAAYSFDSQLYYAVDPIRMAAGDNVQFECTWENTRDKTIVFGDSSLDEMCAVGLYQYATK